MWFHQEAWLLHRIGPNVSMKHIFIYSLMKEIITIAHNFQSHFTNSFYYHNSHSFHLFLSQLRVHEYKKKSNESISHLIF